MSRGLDIASAAEHILHGHNGTLLEATERIAHLDGTKAEMREAIAYLACQVYAYRSSADEHARLAISQVATVVHEYRARMEGANR